MGSRMGKFSSSSTEKAQGKSETSSFDSQQSPPKTKSTDDPVINREKLGYTSMKALIAKSKSSDVCLMDFTLLTTIGRGNFGKVYQVRKKDNAKIYAMKVLSKDRSVKGKKNFERTISERRIVEEMNHPFIARLRYAFQSGTKLYMVFDFFNGGELYHYLSKGRFTEECARFYAAEIILGLGHLHKNGIIYRDLKPENLLLDRYGHIRITDFGLSKINVNEENALTRSICGTPEYLAPEIIKKRPYGKPVDWWSLGTLIYEMLVGLPPFYDKNRQRMYQKILSMKLQQPSYMSNEAFDLCSKLLIRDPFMRIGVKGPDDIMKHDFFKCVDWTRLLNKEDPPPFKPGVVDDLDISNIDPAFTNIVPAVTPTPADAVLVDEDAFDGFTFSDHSVLDEILPNIELNDVNVMDM